MTEHKHSAADTAVLLVCAGNASRMGGIHKILCPLGGRPVLWHSLHCFCQCPGAAEIVVVCRAQDAAEFQQQIDSFALPLPVKIVSGGATRQESVRNGFAACDASLPYIAVHDGARPLLRPEDAERVFADARRTGAAALGVPVKDTVKTVENGTVTGTPDRALLWAVQTPQVFRRTLYAAALEHAAQQGRDYTDDCQLVEAVGSPVTITRGDYTNIKLTTPEDLTVAEAFLKMQAGKGGT